MKSRKGEIEENHALQIWDEGMDWDLAEKKRKTHLGVSGDEKDRALRSKNGFEISAWEIGLVWMVEECKHQPNAKYIYTHSLYPLPHQTLKKKLIFFTLLPRPFITLLILPFFLFSFISIIYVLVMVFRFKN